MKILILTQWFEPEPTIKGMLFARELVARGHEVEVLTGFPNYPGGKVYPGYKIRPWLREEIDTIRVIRVALYPSHDTSSIGRVINYVSFALSAAVFGSALVSTPDVVYVWHPPITVGVAAVTLGFLHRVPFVYDIQDLWPDTVAVSGMLSNRAALKILSKVCAFVYKCAEHIVVPTPGFKKRLTERGVSQNKIDVIYNWCDEKAMKVDYDNLIHLASRADRFSILFAGTMGTAQGLESVLQAAQICQATAPAAEFIFIGGGVERAKLEEMARSIKLGNVRFLPREPMQAMGRILGGADALLVHLKNDPLFRISIPTKTQAYMAAGKPIVMGVSGDAAELVEWSHAGIVCESGNPRSIAAAIKELIERGPEGLAEMGRAGKMFYERELSVAVGVDKFEHIFKMVTGEQIPLTDAHSKQE